MVIKVPLGLVTTTSLSFILKNTSPLVPLFPCPENVPGIILSGLLAISCILFRTNCLSASLDALPPKSSTCLPSFLPNWALSTMNSLLASPLLTGVVELPDMGNNPVGLIAPEPAPFLPAINSPSLPWFALPSFSRLPDAATTCLPNCTASSWLLPTSIVGLHRRLKRGAD
ncbi:Uncharacterised protein [Klebsiella pneumoniae]|nr:Uncharacterised protein [Klebsiella pneumoniae]